MSDQRKYKRVRREIYKNERVTRFATYWLPEDYPLADGEVLIEFSTIAGISERKEDPRPLPEYEGHADGF